MFTLRVTRPTVLSLRLFTAQFAVCRDFLAYLKGNSGHPNLYVCTGRTLDKYRLRERPLLWRYFEAQIEAVQPQPPKSNFHEVSVRNDHTVSRL